MQYPPETGDSIRKPVDITLQLGYYNWPSYNKPAVENAIPDYGIIEWEVCVMIAILLLAAYTMSAAVEPTTLCEIFTGILAELLTTMSLPWADAQGTIIIAHIQAESNRRYSSYNGNLQIVYFLRPYKHESKWKIVIRA